jgi:hypothetical protein
MSLVAPSANLISYRLSVVEAEGTGELFTALVAVVLGSVVLTLWLCRKQAAKHSVVLLPSGLRVSHG